MPIALNHTIVYSRNNRQGAEFLTDLFGLPPAGAWGPFVTVELANEVTLDYLDAEGDIGPQHYCFLVARRSSTRSSVASPSAASRTGQIPAIGCPARSTPTTAAAASTSTIPAATSSRSSLAPTAMSVDAMLRGPGLARGGGGHRYAESSDATLRPALSSSA